MDFTNEAHKTVDGVIAGDLVSILIALGWVLLSLGTWWVSAKVTKASAKGAFKGAKWFMTPRPASELYNSLDKEFDVDATQQSVRPNSDLRVGKVTYHFNPDGNKIVDIRVDSTPSGYVSVGELLPRRERKKLLKEAYALRKDILEEKAKEDKAAVYNKALNALEPQDTAEKEVKVGFPDYFLRKIAETAPKTEAPRPAPALVGMPSTAPGAVMFSNPALTNSPATCGCLDCVSARNRKNGV